MQCKHSLGKQIPHAYSVYLCTSSFIHLWAATLQSSLHFYVRPTYDVTFVTDISWRHICCGHLVTSHLLRTFPACLEQFTASSTFCTQNQKSMFFVCIFFYCFVLLSILSTLNFENISTFWTDCCMLFKLINAPNSEYNYLWI